jgi:hypothetical protein
VDFLLAFETGHLISGRKITKIITEKYMYTPKGRLKLMRVTCYPNKVGQPAK